MAMVDPMGVLVICGMAVTLAAAIRSTWSP